MTSLAPLAYCGRVTSDRLKHVWSLLTDMEEKKKKEGGKITDFCLRPTLAFSLPNRDESPEKPPAAF